MAKSQTGKQGAARRRPKDSAHAGRTTARPSATARAKPPAKAVVRRPGASSVKKPVPVPKKPAAKPPELKKKAQGKPLPAPVTGAGKAKAKAGPGGTAPRIEEIKALVALGKKKGYLTYDEIMSQLPEDESSAERFDEIFRALGEMDIEVVDAPERRKGTDGEEAAEEEASPEAELDLSPAPVGRTDDPVRMYLREMGRTPLLTREGEIRIAKRIEEGRKEVANSVCRAAAAVREILYLGERLEQGRLRIGDLLALNEFEEISEQKERDLVTEIRPVIRTLRNEQAKVEEIRRRMEKAGPRPGERLRNKFDAEIAVRKTKQAEVLRKINLNQRVVDRVVTRMRRFLERIESGERDLLELGKAARLNQTDMKLLVSNGD
ncbi:MAG: rpoD, partial [candidate division NC10 bacterium]|nr:rpoD [candidate division NC10 bacterium]